MEQVEQIEPAVKQILAERLDIPIEKITLESHIADDFGAESLDILMIVSTIETHFDIEVSDEDFAHMQTVGELITALRTHIHQ